MLTKTRTAIITVIASASFTVATLAPAVSQADTKSSSGPTHEETCDKLYGEFERWVDIAEGLYKQEGNGGTFKAVLDTAEATLQAAQNTGCDWASRVQPPEHRFPIVVPVGTLQVATSVGGTVSPVWHPVTVSISAVR
jgi:hypothetical protein